MAAEYLELQRFIEHAPAAVAMFNHDMRYLAASRRWLSDHRLGVEVLGHSHYDVLPDIPERWREVHRRALAGEVIAKEDDRFERADGTVQWLNWEVRPWHTADGGIGGIVISMEEITERKRSDEAFRQSREDFARAQEVGKIGWWRLDTRQNVLSWSDETYRIFGLLKDGPLTYETFLEAVHPDDRDFVDARWQAGIRGEPYDIEHRIVLSEQVKWVREKAYLEFDEGGALLGGFGVVQDITEQKKAQQQLLEAQSRLQAIMRAVPVGISYSDDPSCERITGNPALLSQFEIAPGENVSASAPDPAAPGRQVRYFRDGREIADYELPLQRAIAERLEIPSKEFEVLLPSGRRWFMDASAAPVLGDQGEIIGGVAVTVDTTERRRTEKALREADRRKDEFLAMLAHELRNPLTPIRNAAHILSRIKVDEPHVQWAQGVIERQVAHLARLVDELLDISRIARGKVTLKKSRVELAALVCQACESVQPILSAKRHRFEVKMPQGPVMLEGDPVRLVQVLQNLLHNAAKYTPEGGHVQLVANLSDQEVEIEVRDNGKGIPANFLPEVFELFRQGECGSDRSQGGLGVGLTLVRELVELHGGRVAAYSAGSDLGASFTVRLPVACDAQGEGEMAPADQNSRVQLAGLRVLVVDDDPAVVDSTATLLKLNGHEVRSANSGASALGLLQEFQPQVILLDIGLPGLDGYGVARQIRRLPGCAELKLFAMSGYGDEEAVARSRDAGFDMHLTKPADPEQLSALLADIGAQSECSSCLTRSFAHL